MTQQAAEVQLYQQLFELAHEFVWPLPTVRDYCLHFLPLPRFLLVFCLLLPLFFQTFKVTKQTDAHFLVRGQLCSSIIHLLLPRAAIKSLFSSSSPWPTADGRVVMISSRSPKTKKLGAAGLLSTHVWLLSDTAFFSFLSVCFFPHFVRAE